MSGRKVTPTDHGAWVSIATGILLTYTICFYLIRLTMRLTINGPLRYDDATVTAATVIAIVQSAVKLSQTDMGLGKTTADLSKPRLEEISRLGYVSFYLYLAGLALSKVAAFALFNRLTRHKKHLIASWAGLGFTIAWGIASIILIGVQCPNSTPWRVEVTQCENLYGRWLGVEIIGILIEAYLFALPVYLIWGLRMRMQLKLMVVLAFSFRLPIIIVTAVGLYYRHILISKPDPNLHEAAVSVCTETEFHYSLMAATIPCLKPFMKSLNTGYLSHNAQQAGRLNSALMLVPLSQSQTSRQVHVSSHAPSSNSTSVLGRAGASDKLFPGTDDEKSLSTQASDQRMIRYTREFDISYDDER